MLKQNLLETKRNVKKNDVKSIFFKTAKKPLLNIFLFCEKEIQIWLIPQMQLLNPKGSDR